MINNTARIGNFTSSEIGALMAVDASGKKFGKPALTYISETNMERRLGRSVDDEKVAKALTWGKLLEGRAFGQLGLGYILSSTQTDTHPTIPYWSGSKDALKLDEGHTVADIKCPLTLKSFCQLVDPLYSGLTDMAAMDAIRKGFVDQDGIAHEKHKDGEKFYYQLVSNSIINTCKYAELIVYMPYKSEIDDIKMMAGDVEVQELGKHYWIAMAGEDELPFILDKGFYNSVNIIRFEVPEADKQALTNNVLKAGKMLIGNIPARQLAPVECEQEGALKI